MEEQVRKQNMFYQTRANQAKLGAYYTDQEHCFYISKLLSFPENEEVCPYLMEGAVVVFVLPYYVAGSEVFLKEWCNHFQTLHYYRFHESEFKKWKQIVLIGRRKEGGLETGDFIQGELKNVEKIPLLPKDYQGEKVVILPSAEKDIGQITEISEELPKTDMEELLDFIFI